MTREVWIFGDSYADRDQDNGSKLSWPLQLEKNFNIKNFAKCGTGPNLQFKAMLKQIDMCKDTSNVSIIFLISDINRHNFSFLKSESHSTYMVNVINDDAGIDKASRSLIKEYRKKYGNFIKSFFREYWLYNDLGDLEFLKFIGILKNFSPMFEKVLAINIFEDIDDNNHHYHKIKKSISSDNFHFANGTRLFMYEKMFNTYEPNHMCQTNHNIMYNELSNWINNSINLDLNKLKKINK